MLLSPNRARFGRATSISPPPPNARQAHISACSHTAECCVHPLAFSMFKTSFRDIHHFIFLQFPDAVRSFASCVSRCSCRNGQSVCCALHRPLQATYARGHAIAMQYGQHQAFSLNELFECKMRAGLNFTSSVWRSVHDERCAHGLRLKQNRTEEGSPKRRAR